MRDLQEWKLSGKNIYRQFISHFRHTKNEEDEKNGKLGLARD